MMVALFFLAPIAGLARQQALVCAKMIMPLGWSKAYQVDATIVTGLELGQATGNFTRYQPIATYVVIAWEKDDVSLIQMAVPQLGPLPTRGTDQLGRRWSVSTQSVCF